MRRNKRMLASLLAGVAVAAATVAVAPTAVLTTTAGASWNGATHPPNGASWN